MISHIAFICYLFGRELLLEGMVNYMLKYLTDYPYVDFPNLMLDYTLFE